MRRFASNVGDIEQLRKEREARMNPPEYEIGQDDNDSWDFFDNDGGDGGFGMEGMDDSAFSGLSGNNDLNALGGGMQGGFQQTPLTTSTEDKFFDGLGAVCKFLFKHTKSLFNGINSAFKDNDAFYWTTYGKKVMVFGVWISVVGLVLTLLGTVTVIKEGFWVLIGGLLNLSIGLLVFCLNCERAVEISKNMDVNAYQPQEENLFEEEEDISDGWGNLNEFEEEEESNGWGSYSEESEDDYESDDSYDPWNSIEDIEDSEPIIDNVEEDIEKAIEGIRDIPAHTQTRQYLFEEYSRVLPLVNPQFASLKTISENSDDFIIFDKILRDASLQVGTNEEKLPLLLELRENQFIIQIKATRPSGLKEDDIANEIATIYSRDEYGSVIHEGVYATTSSVGSNFIINIFKGENSLVTLADTYKEVKDFILDTSIKKPVVMGVNELGKVWTFDAEKVFSYIISGKPRSGKSWSVVSLVLQLCMYSSPKEVNFEVFDVKNSSSDYYNMQGVIPHIKRFESNGKRILQRLRQIVTVEKERREAILKKNGVIAIADLKEKGVDAELPYLYILIDEIIGLKKDFTKEENAEFKELVNVMITLMPNVGVRLILVPHRVTNDIVPKTTYTNVGCIACVRSDNKEIVNTLDITKKDFPYDLVNSGDMALKSGEVNKGKTVFCHGVAITTSNEKNVDIYKFIGSLWGRLEPDTIKQEEFVEEREQYQGSKLIGEMEFEEANDDSIDDFWNDLI